jgi:hypothetical protein
MHVFLRILFNPYSSQNLILFPICFLFFSIFKITSFCHNSFSCLMAKTTTLPPSRLHVQSPQNHYTPDQKLQKQQTKEPTFIRFWRVKLGNLPIIEAVHLQSRRYFQPLQMLQLLFPPLPTQPRNLVLEREIKYVHACLVLQTLQRSPNIRVVIHKRHILGVAEHGQPHLIPLRAENRAVKEIKVLQGQML